MDQDRWQRVDALLDGALDRPRSERMSWLVEACAGDDALVAEVERLLELAKREDDVLAPGGVFAGPIGEEVARELAGGGGARGTVQLGESLGRYRLVELLGKGGMGRVYSAEDSKLGRRIALKLLPPEMASAERRNRFEREAKAIASLNHPNIVHVYSIEEADGIAFLTMELVSGETLGERIPATGLPLKKFFETAIPIADALAAAHDKGVIHRDLKPDNVMVGKDGRIKILDFGLAKLAVHGGGAESSAERSSTTEEGYILGTISYMSPEQAEGRPIDHRTDVFSLGILLYEMSTGRTPFTGDTPTSILSSILKDTPPPVTDVNPRLPKDLGRIITRCLAKDPERRYQTVVDVRTELEELEYVNDSRKLFQPAVDRERRLGAVVMGVVVGVALVLGAYLLYLARDVRNRSVDLLAGTFSQLTSEAGAELFPTLSPDGSFLVYASRAAGNWDVYLLRASGRRPINLTEDSRAEDTQPAFSPDGEHIAFHSSRQGGGIFVMGATGESARRVVDFGWNPAWSPDGTELVFATSPVSHDPFDRPSRSALWTVQLETGETKLLTEGDAVQPSWSPHGHRIAYWGLLEGGAQRDLYTLSADPASDEDPIPVTRDAALDWNPVWSPDGRFLYFSSDRGGSMNLWRVRVDERSGRVIGEPEPVRTPAGFATHMSFSRDGARMAYTSTLTSLTLECREFDARSASVGSPVALAKQIRHVSSPRVSPDGSAVAYSREGMQEDILIAKVDGSEERLLTDDPARDRYPQWAPDGSTIVFYSNRSGNYEVWGVSPDGADLRQLTDMPERPTRYPIFSPDGSRLLFSSPGNSGLLIDAHAPEPAKTAEALPLYPSDAEEFVPLDWSRDGKRIVAYLQTRAGPRAGIAVYSFETGRYEKLTEFGHSPHWLPDGRRILFQGLGPERPQNQWQLELDYKLFIVDRETREFKELLAVLGASVEAPVLSPDGTKLFFVRGALDADVWMLDAASEEEESSGPGL
jgi:eukaryotic-like serine/threonine-protein kinase